MRRVFILAVFILSIAFPAIAGIPGPCTDTASPPKKILIVVDGIPRAYTTDTKLIDSLHKPDKVNKLPPSEAVAKYGEKARDGAIEITSDNNSDTKIIIDSPDTDAVFTKVEIEASFTGGNQAWRKYLEKNLNGSVPTDNDAPIGLYTVIVQFVVDKEGNVGDMKALTNHGYGMEEEVMRAIIKGPKWSPALQGGRAVKAYRKQPVTFMVEDADIDVTTEKGYTLKAGIANPVTIHVGKVKQQDIIISVSGADATISKTGPGQYEITPAKAGKILMTITDGAKNKVAGRVSFTAN